jgi:hypothetical protein
MKSKNAPFVPFQKIVTRSVPKQLRGGNAAIEVHSGTTPTLDVRFLCVAIHYPYMFEKPIGDLRIDRQWATAFSLTCMEIDAALGNSTHGFCWRMLDMQDGKPGWFWSLAPEYNQRVLVIAQEKGARVELANSVIDPDDTLRKTIQAIIDRGVQRALCAQQGAANDSAFGNGGLQ